MSARLGRLMLATIIGVVFAVVLPLAAFADGLVTVDCGDGSPLRTSADVTMLSSIQASIQGMIDNPSGTNCSLSQDALATPTLTLGSSASGSPYVVGGGRYSRGFGPGPMQGCGVSFGISAHQDATGYFGSQSFTVNNADGCETFEFNGHIKANVICLDVSGHVAQIKGTVTQSTGYYATALPVGTLIETDVVDNGNPSSGVPDTIDTPQPADAICVAGTDLNPPFTLDNGNITVHD